MTGLIKFLFNYKPTNLNPCCIKLKFEIYILNIPDK